MNNQVRKNKVKKAYGLLAEMGLNLAEIVMLLDNLNGWVEAMMPKPELPEAILKTPFYGEILLSDIPASIQTQVKATFYDREMLSITGVNIEDIKAFCNERLIEKMRHQGELHCEGR